MKYILAAALVLILSFPITVEAIDTITITATTTQAQTRLNAKSYTIINDGADTFFWFCDGSDADKTVDVAAGDAAVKTGESISVDEPCNTMNHDTVGGANATVRIFFIQSNR